jgi:CBS domain containing-hemolysin-like protein
VQYNRAMIAAGIFAVITGTIVVLLAAMQPSLPTYSQFELRRRSKTGHEGAKLELMRLKQAAVVIGWQRIIIPILFVIVSFLFVAAFGWLIGLLGLLVFVLSYQYLAGVSVVSRNANKLYARYEMRLLTFLQNHSFVRNIGKSSVKQQDVAIGSREELTHQLERSSTWLLPVEKRHLLGMLRFSTLQAGDLMTPRSLMKAVPHDELLGPLSIDTLHKTGHRQFPVINGESIVGLLDISQFLSVRSLSHQKAYSAKEVMKSDILYVDKSASLEEVLRVCLDTKNFLAVVRDAEEPIGLITLSAIIAALLGDNEDMHTKND